MLEDVGEKRLCRGSILRGTGNGRQQHGGKKRNCEKQPGAQSRVLRGPLRHGSDYIAGGPHRNVPPRLDAPVWIFRESGNSRSFDATELETAGEARNGWSRFVLSQVPKSGYGAPSFAIGQMQAPRQREEA